jgi:hypothetical protein
MTQRRDDLAEEIRLRAEAEVMAWTQNEEVKVRWMPDQVDKLKAFAAY